MAEDKTKTTEDSSSSGDSSLDKPDQPSVDLGDKIVDSPAGEEEINEEINGTEPRIYELGYLLVPSIKEDDLEGEVAKLKGLLEGVKGTFISEEAPKDIELSYEMRKGYGGKYDKFNNAYFGWMKFEVEGGGAVALDIELKKSETLLRHIIIKTVRENTRSTVRIAPQLETAVPVAPVAKRQPVKRVEEKSVPVSEEELDKSIEELVVE